VAQRARKQNKDAASPPSPDKKDLLSLRNDIIFKMTFGDIRNKHLLRAFLLAVLDLPEEEYGEIEIIDPHLRGGFPDEKLGILDVRIKTKNGKQIDIEIQVARTPFMQERITAYAARMLTSQLGVGEKYTELKKVVSILILDYDLIPDSQYFHNKYMLYDAKTKSLFTSIIEIHTLELQKVPAEADGAQTDKKTTREILWLQLIRAKEEEEVKMLAAKSPEIKEAYAVLKKLSEDEKVRLLYESREKAIWDEQARLYGARKDGREEGIGIGREEGIGIGREEGIGIGREEGKHEKALDIARKFIERGLDVNLIATGTGLTVEEVQSLQSQHSSIKD
jgi:predicted transposase/invertase (TIGR01784 family)